MAHVRSTRDGSYWFVAFPKMYAPDIVVCDRVLGVNASGAIVYNGLGEHKRTDLVPMTVEDFGRMAKRVIRPGALLGA